MKLIDFLCDVNDSPKQYQSLAINSNGMRTSSNWMIWTCDSVPLLLRYYKFPGIIKHIIEVISSSKQNHLISNCSQSLTTSRNWEIICFLNLMIRMMSEKLLPFVGRKVIHVQVVMPYTIYESAKEEQVISI